MPEAPSDNVFARILRGDLPCHKVYEDQHCLSFLDICPLITGHTLVVPKSYSPNLLAADVDGMGKVMLAIQRVARAVQQATLTSGVTVLTNCGRDAGQTVEYLHWHVLPRRFHDQLNFNVIGAAAEDSALQKVAEAIRSALAQQESR